MCYDRNQESCQIQFAHCCKKYMKKADWFLKYIIMSQIMIDIAYLLWRIQLYTRKEVWIDPVCLLLWEIMTVIS